MDGNAIIVEITEEIQCALKKVSDMVVMKNFGYNELPDDAKEKLADALYSLIAARDSLVSV